MGLTIGEALQQGVEAHKAGKLQDAERLYRSILEAQPMHAGANHNLGVLAVSINQAGAALPFLKKAIDANPKIEQFWLSYIDALIKEGRLDDAREALSQACDQSQSKEKLGVFDAKLASVPEGVGSATARVPAQSQINSLLKHYQKGEFDVAEELALTVTEEFPEHDFGWKVLGALYGQSGRASEAANANQKAATLSPLDSEVHSNLGVSLKELGQLEEAILSYKKAISLKADYPEAHYNLGVALQDLGRLEEAKVSYSQAIMYKPEFAEAHSNLGNLLQELGKFDDAEKSFRKAIDLRPDYAEAHINLGNVLREHGSLKEAEVSHRRAIELNPELSEAHCNLANTLRELNYLEEAEKSFERAIQLKPDYADAHLNYGILLRAQERHEESVESFLQAIKFDPDNWEAHTNLGTTYKMLSEPAKAKQYLLKSITLKPDLAEAHLHLGLVYSELKEFELAEQSVNRAINLNTDYAEAHYELGNIFQSMGRMEKATKSFRDAIEWSASYPSAHFNLGNLLLIMGQLTEAEESLRQAISLKTDFAQAHNNLGIVLWESGRLDEAEQSYNQAIQLKPDYAEAYYNLGVNLKECNKPSEAVSNYKRAIECNSAYIEAHNELLKCLYLLNHRSSFIQELDWFIENDKINSVIGSLTSRSALKYGLDKPNLFCEDPLKYVLHKDLNIQYDFEESLASKMNEILSQNRTTERNQNLLINGYQTAGNLFDLENELTREIQEIIRLEVENYRSQFHDSEEGFLVNWPLNYSLYGWLIRMKSGGNITPHIHDNAWMIGSIYINMPPKPNADSGNLVVSLGEDSDATEERQNLKKSIDVRTGSLVLFPGSLTHYSIPFESHEDRIVLAFNINVSPQ